MDPLYEGQPGYRSKKQTIHSLFVRLPWLSYPPKLGMVGEGYEKVCYCDLHHRFLSC